MTLGQAGLVKELFDVIDCMRSPPRKKFMVGPVQNWDPQLEPDLIVYNAVSLFVESVTCEWNQCTMDQACWSLLGILYSVEHDCFYCYVDIECLRATKAMGRDILGVATVEREEHSPNKYNIWSCNGGMLIVLLVQIQHETYSLYSLHPTILGPKLQFYKLLYIFWKITKHFSLYFLWIELYMKVAKDLFSIELVLAWFPRSCWLCRMVCA